MNNLATVMYTRHEIEGLQECFLRLLLSRPACISMAWQAHFIAYLHIMLCFAIRTSAAADCMFDPASKTLAVYCPE